MEPLRKPRRATSNAPRNGALARIHILKKECGLTDDQYRDLIQTLTNGRTRSAGDCDHTERERIAAHLTKLHGCLRPQATQQPRAARKALSGPQKKVFAVWKRLEAGGALRSGEYRSLRTFVQRQTGLSDLAFCDGQACSTLIESLKAWAKRLQIEVER